MTDLKFAFRQLAKCRGFTAVAVLTLALGIGANTAIFSVLNAIMFRPLPYAEPTGLVSISRTSKQSRHWPDSPANYLDYRQQSTVFENVAALRNTQFSMAQPGEPAESVRGIAATADFFPALRLQPILGRVFTAAEDVPGRNQVVVLSHSFWMGRFAGDRNIIGRTLRMDGEPVTVIGVMPPRAEYPQLWGRIDAWRPLALNADQQQNRRDCWLSVTARLKNGVSLAQANAETAALAAHLAKAYPEYNADYHLRVTPLREAIGDEASRRFAWLLLGLTAFVLLIACANLANLQLARAATRSREFAVRLALGIGRGRLLWQLFVESLVISLLGGVAGILLASWLNNFIGGHLTRWSPEGLPVPLDSDVLLFALLCSVTTALLFGMAPAWLASRTSMNEVLKTGTRGSTAGHSQNRLRHGMIVGQVALALVLLTGAGLFIGGLHQFVHHDPGWKVDGLLTGWVPLTSSKYDSLDQQRAFVERLEERLARQPGVEHASVSSSLPVWSFGTMRPFLIEGRPVPPRGQEPILSAESISPAYLTTMGLRLLKGRPFTTGDTTNRPNVVIINEAMAKHFWPNENPLGQRIGGYDRANPDPDWQEIVGVVNDIHFPGNLARPDTIWQVYRPFFQEPRQGVILELRTLGPPAMAAAALRRAVAGLDSDLPINDLEVTRQLVDRMLEHFELGGLFLGAFAVLGLVLAALGLYGVISYFVAQRTSEIGIRMALGAQLRDILWMVLSRGLWLSVWGLGLGLAGAFLVARLLASAVPSLNVAHPLTCLGVVTALLIVIFFSCWLPARRATTVDPMEALRCE